MDARFLNDWSGVAGGTPSEVHRPASTEEVAAIVRRCQSQNQRITVQGGMTGLAGGAVPGDGDVVINLERMNRIEDIDELEGVMLVQAGATLQQVQEAAAQRGWMFALDLGARGSCQVGGNAATNAGGIRVIRYGTMRDAVLGVEAVLADGTVVSSLSRLVKNSTGFDPRFLFIGTEGTLGIITAATLKLHPLPTHHALAWFAPLDPAAALHVLGLFQAACGARLNAFEMINRRQLELVIEHVPERRDPFGEAHEWHVLIELADTQGGDEMADLLQRTLEQAAEAGLVVDAVVASNDSQRAALWEIRHSVSEANKKGGVGLTTDCAVPVSAVPAFIDQATRAVHAIVDGLAVLVVAHLGDGNAHFIPFFTFDAWRELADPAAMAAALRRAVNDVAHELRGTFSAEHGVGQTGLTEMAHYKSAVELSLMRAVKQALDPHNLLNPGRLLP
jgi:FAD/FMN-containing dehydrogenase